MKIQKKPDYLVFAEDAKSGELTSFPDVKRGWGVTIDQTASKPPMEWMNGAFNRLDANMLYLLQQGVAEWDSSVTYPVDAIVKYKSKLYIALVQNDNAIPTTSSTKWTKVIADIADASLTQKGLVKLNSATNSSSETEAATPKAVKSAYDLASGAVKKTGDNMSGDLVINKSGTSQLWLGDKKFGIYWTGVTAGFNSPTDKGYTTTRLRYTPGNNNENGFWNFENSSVTIDNKSLLKEGDLGLSLLTQSMTRITSINQISIMKSGERYFAVDSTAQFLPTTYHGYLIKIGARDNSGGGLFLFCEYNETGKMFFGQQQRDKDSVDWKEVVTTDRLNNYFPVGIPQPWPTATPPDGWLKCNGSAFDKVKYPKLASVYTNGYLPDLRAEFIRGFDDGKGVDSGRKVGSWQSDAIRNITGTLGTTYHMPVDSFTGPFEKTNNSFFLYNNTNQNSSGNAVNFDVSKVVPTANENRPRNVAFLYIVKAE